MTIETSNSSTTMEPLFECLLQRTFSTSTEAINFCRESCLEYGFSIKQEVNSANRKIYIHCAHEQDTNIIQQRKRSAKNNIDCSWRIVLNEEEATKDWVFRKSLNPNASEHNHSIDNGSIWPQPVQDRLAQLARQRDMQMDEIRETIKLQFPDITWNDRCIQNYVTEERRKIRQKDITERVQRLIMASTRLCSVVAANEEWAACVETDIAKMLENYKQSKRLSTQSVNSMVDLQLDMVHSEIDKNRRPSKRADEDVYLKKRKTTIALRNEQLQQGIQVMSIPSCTLYVRSQPLRSLSEPSTQNRRPFTDLIASSSSSSSSAMPPQQPMPFGVSNLFSMTSPVSSPSSTSSLQQRIDCNTAYRNNSSNNNGNNDMLQSPPIPDAANMMMAPGYSSNAAYTASSSQFGGQAAANDINFNFEPANSMANTPHYHPQHVSPSSAPIMMHHRQSNTDRIAGYPGSMGYYSSSPSSLRESSPSIQQRIMMHQEYEQHQRHLQQMETSSANIHLPLIRSTTPLSGNLIHQHQSSGLNPNHAQNWS